MKEYLVLAFIKGIFRKKMDYVSLDGPESLSKEDATKYSFRVIEECYRKLGYPESGCIMSCGGMTMFVLYEEHREIISEVMRGARLHGNGRKLCVVYPGGNFYKLKLPK